MLSSRAPGDRAAVTLAAASQVDGVSSIMPVWTRRRLVGWTLGAAAASQLIACYGLNPTGPTAPVAVQNPLLVSVTIEYTQPPGCLGGGHCNDKVVFFGDWMRPGTEFFLTPDPGNFTWRGVALGVPVNYPPHENPTPYQVRIYDPHLLAGPTRGFTGDRLLVGSESLNQVQSSGTPGVYDLVYIDSNGQGHNAY